MSLKMILSVNGQQVEKCAKDIMLNLGTSYPAIVLDPDHESMGFWENQLSATLVALPNNPNDVNVATDYLKKLIALDEIDFILFTIPIASPFITDMANELGTHHPKIAMLIPHGYPVSFPLRLDSRLFFYKISGESITLFEKYYIRFPKAFKV